MLNNSCIFKKIYYNTSLTVEIVEFWESSLNGSDRFFNGESKLRDQEDMDRSWLKLGHGLGAGLGGVWSKELSPSWYMVKNWSWFFVGVFWPTESKDISMNVEKLGVGDGDLLESSGIEICGGDVNSGSWTSLLMMTLSEGSSPLSLVSTVAGMRVIEVESMESTTGRGNTWTTWAWAVPLVDGWVTKPLMIWTT